MSDLADLLDIAAAQGMSRTNWQPRWPRSWASGIPWNVLFLGSPDVGLGLARDGVLPLGVRISWASSPGYCYAVLPDDGPVRD